MISVRGIAIRRGMRRAAVWAGGAALIAGCAAVGPDYRAPEHPAQAGFVNAGEPAFETGRINVEWWKQFNEPMLNRLMEAALAGSPDLRVATARLREARGLLVETRFDRYPTVTSSAAYTNERRSRVTVPSGADRDLDLYSVGFDAAWELDFFGRVRREVEARGADLESAEASRRDVAVSLVAEVARNYFELRGSQKRLEVALQNASNQLQTLNLTEVLLDGGRGNALDVARAEAQYDATLATIPPLQTAVKNAMHRIAVLTGRAPTAWASELDNPSPMPALPSVIAIDTPADLLRRRPDIRAAERNLAAATARIGVAVADLFPRVTLFGGLGLEAGSLSSLGNGGAGTWSIGPSIVWLAAFDLGRVRARIEQAQARSVGTLATYERTVLAALEDTENALVSFSRERIRQERLAKRERASTRAAELSRIRFQEGVASFIDVLDAERVKLEAQDQLVVSETASATALVALYKALGGGWEADETDGARASSADSLAPAGADR